MKQLLFAVVLAFSAQAVAQNVEFKAANFKNDKEGFKKIELIIEKGDAFFKLGNEALFEVQPFGLNYKKALQQYEQAQQYNPNSALMNFKIGVCHANSSDASK
ncbi:MAG: hypothetical protein HYZ43_17050, partial [Flavobacteriia bacterium]|nr:hypothetical protein [Flavobacteriia bacterium]